MRRFLSFSAVTLLCAAPIVASAYFLRPSAVLTEASFNGQPMDFTYEARLTYEKAYNVTATFAGSLQGRATADTKADMRFGVNVKASEGTLNAKVQMRVKDQTAYFMLESLDGSLAKEFDSYASSIQKRQWYSVQLKDVQKQTGQSANGLTEQEVKEIMAQVVDAIFSLKREAKNGGSLYIVSLKRTAVMELKKTLQRLSKQYPELSSYGTMSESDARQLRKLFTKITYTMKMTADASDKVTVSKLDASYRDGALQVTLQGAAMLRATPVTVTVPAGAKSIEELESQYRSKQLSQLMDVQRRSDVYTIINAAYYYAIDHNALPKGITTQPQEICNNRATSCGGLLNLNVLLGTYMVNIPRDPTLNDGSARTGYRIWQDANGRVTVEAMYTDGAPISVTR